MYRVTMKRGGGNMLCYRAERAEIKDEVVILYKAIPFSTSGHSYPQRATVAIALSEVKTIEGY